jgi:hypothetical protein
LTLPVTVIVVGSQYVGKQRRAAQTEVVERVGTALVDLWESSERRGREDSEARPTRAGRASALVLWWRAEGEEASRCWRGEAVRGSEKEE